jgi:hypothetical protein
MPISNGSVKKKQKSTEQMVLKNENDSKIRVLIITESFHPYTSGIARRFKEIIERLVERKFLIHVITGCKVLTTKKKIKFLNYL